MNGNDISVITLVIVSFLTWLVFVITACKFYKFFDVFENYKSKNDVELNSLVWHAKKLDGSLAEITAELRRANKLLYEIDIGRSTQPEPQHEQDFNTEDILRHNKLDLNKTPSSLPVDFSSPPPEHKTVADVAGLQHCLDELAKSAGPGEKPNPVHVPAHGSLHLPAHETAHGSHSTQPISEHPAHASLGQQNHSSGQLNQGSSQLKKTPAVIDMGHLHMPPDDLSGKLSIDTLSSKAGQIDLKHLTESPNAVCVKTDKSHK